MAFGKGHHLHLIDGSAFIFRAYHALPPLTRKSDGLPIGAVSGFCNMLHRYVEANTGPDAPTHAAVIFLSLDMQKCTLNMSDTFSSSRSSPLILAAKTGAEDLACLLVNLGAQVNAVDYRHFTALHYASYTE